MKAIIETSRTATNSLKARRKQNRLIGKGKWPGRDITHSCANCGHPRNLHPRGRTCSVYECQCRDFQAE